MLLAAFATLAAPLDVGAQTPTAPTQPFYASLEVTNMQVAAVPTKGELAVTNIT
jgi:hypothetical protein